MTKERLKELQTEIAKLKKTDNNHTERVAAEFESLSRKELAEQLMKMPELETEIEVPCSAELDNEWYNESI